MEPTIEADKEKTRVDTAFFFSNESPFLTSLPGFTVRTEQQQYAEYVEKAIATQKPLLAEAGTGTGKTIGYLLPALQSGLKVLVSTGTKTLQDQLFLRDLPTLLKAVDSDASVALLKGRNNYLCLHRLQKQTEQPMGLFPEDMPELKILRNWSEQTFSGEFSESGISEKSRTLTSLSAASDHCIGRECSFWSDCFLVKARNRAQKADIVVVNHHLVCADLHLREEQQIEVIPAADVIIFDEAHQLPSIISDFFSDQTSVRQIQRTVEDSKTAVFRDCANPTALSTLFVQLEADSKFMQQSLTRRPGRWAWSALLDDTQIIAALSEIIQRLTALYDELKAREKASSDVERCHKRVLSLITKLKKFQGLRNQASTQSKMSDFPDEGIDAVRWLEIAQRNARWMFTPLDAGEKFANRLMELAKVPIFTSATLESGGSFEHIRKGIGIYDGVEVVISSPYRYENQVMRYEFSDLPEPSHPLYYEKVFTQLLGLFDSTQGRAFLLMTSHRDIERAARFFEQNPLMQTVLIQGREPKNQLLDLFRKDGNAVLIGTQSFWEGVDIKGAALSCVVIAKLPFAPPDDPVLQAKSDTLKQRGGNPFMTLQLPESIILFKQGIGRLIRDEADKGVLAIADPRLRTKQYGRHFAALVDAAPATKNLLEIEHFLSSSESYL